MSNLAPKGGTLKVLGAVDVTDKPSTRTNLEVFSQDEVRDRLAARAPRQGVVSTGATFAGYTADNTSLAFGTDDLTIGMWVRLANWSSTVRLLSNLVNPDGFQLRTSAGALSLLLGSGSGDLGPFNSTVATGLPANSWAFLAVVLDRDGNMVAYINGEQIGSPVDISAASAFSFDGPALYWLSSGSAHHAGTLGETFIAQGALTADQIAAIAKAGTAVGAGLTTYQHLVPSDSLAAGIYEDVSGNANHAALGASGISTVIPIDLPSPPPPQALRGDGSAASRNYATVQSPGTDAFALDFTTIYPQDTLSSAKAIISLSSTYTGDVRAARAFVVAHSTSLGLYITQYGATGNDYIRLRSLELHDQLVALGARGVPVTIVLVHTSAGLTVWKLVPGLRPLNVTNLFADQTAGTPPAWSETITGTYLVTHWLSSSVSSAFSLVGQQPVALLTGTPTSADMEYRVRNGRWHPKFAKGSKVALMTTDFSAGADSFSGVSCSVAGNQDGVGGEDNNLLVNSAGATVAITLRSLPFIAGQRYSFSIPVYVPSTNVTGATVGITDQNNNPLGVSNIEPIDDTWTLFTGEFTAPTGMTGFRLTMRTLASSATLTAGDGFYVGSGGIMTALGVTTALDTQDGAGNWQRNPRAENGSSDWILSDTGVTRTGEADTLRGQPMRFRNVNVGTAAYLGQSGNMLRSGDDVVGIQITNNGVGSAVDVKVQLSDGTNHSDLMSVATIAAGATLLVFPTLGGLDTRRRLRAVATSGADNITFAFTVKRRL